MLRSNLCGYTDAYIVVKRNIDLAVDRNNDMTQKSVIFKNNGPSRSFISKISNIFIDNAENFGTVMSMYNLLEYSDNFSMTSESLWNYYKDKVDNVNDNDSNGKSFKYKTKRKQEEYRGKTCTR